MLNKLPVILVDVADNISEGTSGDGTELLRELLKKNADGAVLKEQLHGKQESILRLEKLYMLIPRGYVMQT